MAGSPSGGAGLASRAVAGLEAFEAARAYGYRLLELKDEHDAKNPSGAEYSDKVACLVRCARHATIAAMRSDLGLVAAPLSDHYHGFIGTTFEDEFDAARERRRCATSPASGSPGSFAASGDAGEKQRPVA